jgi:DNA-directed RNA polymerase subunit RPC12/RpoP
MDESAQYRCPECGETHRLEAEMTALYTRVSLDADGDFSAFNGKLSETEIVAVSCGHCGHRGLESNFAD